MVWPISLKRVWAAGFFLGAHNRLMQRIHARQAAGRLPLAQLATTQATAATGAAPTVRTITGGADTDTLFRLLMDEDRVIQTQLGHSKGCLSIAAALEVLACFGAKTAAEKARSIRVITTGAVVEIPGGFHNVVQFLGNLDGFGAMNSRLRVPYEPALNAWHHVNTAIPFHMDIRKMLARADVGGGRGT